MDGQPPTGPLKRLDEPGIKATGQLASNMRAEVAHLLGRHQTNFPGSQPVSFSKRHMEELLKQDYFVCEKSDGLRYLLYLTQDDQGAEVQYLIDRRNDFWWVQPPLHLPTPADEGSFHKDTIMDGELVMDDLGKGQLAPRYIVFDCLILDGQTLMQKDLSKRLGYFREAVFKPYQSLFNKYPDEKQFQPFLIEQKDMQFAYATEMMFKTVIPGVKHGNDGLIFTCLHSEYKPGTDPHILKWKEANENTVDFRWKFTFPEAAPSSAERAEGFSQPFIDFDAKPRVELLANHGNNKYERYEDLWLEDAEWEELKSLDDPLDERVVECYMDEQGRWRFYRFRDDKADANHISVVEKVIDSIKNPVTKDELIAAAKSIRDSWKERQARGGRPKP